MCLLTSRDGILLLRIEFLYLCSSAQLESACITFSGLPKLLQQQWLLVVPQRSQALGSPPPTSSDLTFPFQTPDDVAQDIRMSSVLVEGVSVESLFDQLVRAGTRSGQDTLVVGTCANFIPKDFQDPRGRTLSGQLCRVVRRALWGFSRGPSVPASVGSRLHRNTVSVAQRSIQNLSRQRAVNKREHLCSSVRFYRWGNKNCSKIN